MLVADGHKAQQHLGHAKIAEAPRQRGKNGEEAIAARRAKLRHAAHRLLYAIHSDGRSDAEKVQETRDGTGIVQHGVQAARGHCARNDNDNQRHNHDDGLHKIRSAFRQKTADNRVYQHEHRADNHHGHIVQAKQRGKQLAAGDQAACRIHCEEYKDEKGGNRHHQLALFMEAVGKKLRQRNGVARLFAVPAQPFGGNQPVHIGTQGQADGRPRRVGNTAPIGHAGQPHQKPARHIRGLRAHGRNPRPQRAAAEEISLGAFVRPFGKRQADADYRQHVNRHNNHNLYAISHTLRPPMR